MESLNLIYYSPTGTTKKIIKEIASNLGIEEISEYNITKSDTEINPKTEDNSLTIIGLPVYSGRLPQSAIESLKKFKSNLSPAVIIVVYGNRDFDDSLLELEEIMSLGGFHIIAAGAFIGEHSFSSLEKPIAKDRPDQQDMEKCHDFSQMIQNKINSKATEISVPGNFPYKELKKLPVDTHPETDPNKCTNCSHCIEICPTSAITIEQTIITNGEKCIWCFACIKGCPSEARIFDHPNINAIKDKLFLNCSTRREPEFFI